MSFAKWQPFCLGPNVSMLYVCRYRATLVSYRVGAVWCSPSEVRKDQPCLPFRGLSQGGCHLHAVHVTFRWGLSCCSVNYGTNVWYTLYAWIDLIHKSQNATVPYPSMLHSEQKCAHFCSEWGIVGYGKGAFCKMGLLSIISLRVRSNLHRDTYRRWNDSSNSVGNQMFWSIRQYGKKL